MLQGPVYILKLSRRLYGMYLENIWTTVLSSAEYRSSLAGTAEARGQVTPLEIRPQGQRGQKIL